MSEFRGEKFIIIAAVLVLSGSFLFLGQVKNTAAFINNYNKAYNGTLTAAEWNNLAADFLNATGPAHMDGPLGIGTGTPAFGLEVNGPIKATNFTGSITGLIDAANVMGGNGSSFGSNSGGGNYSFPGNLGVGTTTMAARLAIQGNGGDLINLFDSSAVEKLTVLSSGNVGIGVTNPLSKLDVAGVINASDISQFTGTVANNSWLNPTYTTAGGIIAFSSVPKYLWHDRLAFNKAWGVPTFETYDVGTGTWSSSAVNSALFAQQENQSVLVIDGTTKTAARWTWNSGNASYAMANWWVIGITYTATASSKNFLIESSADGVNWTTRYTSTGNTANYSPVWLKVGDNGGDSYFRLTITVTNSVPLRLSSIKALSARWGDQGGGSEQEYPYTWDSSQNIFFSGNVSLTGTTGLTLSGAGADLNFTGTGPNQIITASGVNLALMPGGTGNVGIGTTLPGVKLDVNGAIRGNSITATTVLNGVVMADASGNFYATSSTVASGIPVGTNGQTLRSNGTSWLANSVLFNDGTNVGIGTTNPGNSKLYIHSATSAQVVIHETTNGGVSTPHLDFLSSQGAVDVGAGVRLGAVRDTAIGGMGFALSVTANNAAEIAGIYTQALTVLNNGNVGIGTTTPTRRLVVSGGTADINVFTNTGTEALDWPFAGLAIRRFDDYTKMKMLQMGHRDDNTYQTSDTAVWNFFLKDEVGSKVLSDTNTDLVLGGPGDLILFPAGNVGIGTTAPGYKLHVSSTEGATIKIEGVASSGTDQDIRFTTDRDSGDATWTLGKDNTDNYFKLSYATGLVGGLGAGDLLTVTSGGNVGIGTTVPNDTLSIGNSGAAPAGSLATGHNFTSTYLSTDNYALVNYGIVKSLISSATSTITLWGGATGGNIWSLNSGNVGIGTTNPLAKLDIASSAGFTRVIKVGTGSTVVGDGSYIEFPSSTSDGYGAQIGGVRNVGGNGMGDLVIRTGGIAQQERMRILDGGNVGIGTTVPGKLLEVAGAGQFGTAGATTSQLTVLGGSGGNAMITLSRTSGTTISFSWALAGAGLSFTDNTNGGTPLNLFGGTGSTGLQAFVGQRGSLTVTTAGSLLGATTFAAGAGTDVAATNFTIQGSLGTGAGTLGNIYFNTGVLGVSGTTAQTASTKMTILGSGNVGIGTSVPNDTLSIGNSGAAPAGSLATGHNFTSTYLSTDNYALTNYGLVKSLISAATSTITLWGGSTGGNVWSLNSGNVGIGTVNPLELLELSKSVATTGVWAKISNTVSSGMVAEDVIGGYKIYGRDNTNNIRDAAEIVAVQNQTPSGLTVYSPRLDFKLYNYNSGADSTLTKMSILNNGNVGIGTTLPGVKLDVNGALRATTATISTVINGIVMADASGNFYATSTAAATGQASSIFLTTVATYTGSLSLNLAVGYEAGNNICAAELSGSHFCRTDEIVFLIQRNGASGFAAINGADAWIAEGPPGFTGTVSADDCGGYTDGTTSKLGHFWIFSTSGGGRGSLSSCDTQKKIACCR